LQRNVPPTARRPRRRFPQRCSHRRCARADARAPLPSARPL